MPPSPRITIRLTPEIEALVSDRVRQGARVSDIVREALEAYLGARPTARPTQETSASARATSTAATMGDAVSDIRSAMMSDVSDIRQRLGHLEQRVEALSASVRHSRAVSDTPETLGMPPVQASDTVSDNRQTLEETISSTPIGRLSDTHAPVSPGLSDTDVPAFDPNKFVLGKLCPRGHEYHGTGKTLRRVFRHVCPACDVERTREARQARRDAAP
jgi:Arc/MetJ-type ribon-helix-helix transcriptional regulator